MLPPKLKRDLDQKMPISPKNITNQNNNNNKDKIIEFNFEDQEQASVLGMMPY